MKEITNPTANQANKARLMALLKEGWPDGLQE